ncbi:MAG: hypothetical protein DDT33_01682 [Firmicutes bacterium]|nr:hypothetical protein [Bacillota bacterium]
MADIVVYATGKGQYTKGLVDYMSVCTGSVQLYAELPVYAAEDECCNYDALRASILSQADASCITRENLRFPFDV